MPSAWYAHRFYSGDAEPLRRRSLANGLAGNAASSLLNLGLAVSGNQSFSGGLYPGAPGLGLGIPINDVLSLSGQATSPIFSSPAGAARSTVTQTLFNAAVDTIPIASMAAEGWELAVQGGLTAGEFASGIGIAQFGFDALTVGNGYLFACSQ